MNGMGSGDMAQQKMPNYRRQNERYLLDTIKNQLGITEEDMETPNVVKAKVRESNIDKVLQK